MRGLILQVGQDGTRTRTRQQRVAGASSEIGFTTQNLSRETFGDMRCRTLGAPAPGAAGTTRPPVVTPCDASPDLGPVHSPRSRVRAYSSPHRPHHATPATNSLSTLDSLQLLPWLARREAREPLGDTHTGLGRSGPPPNLHRGGKHDSGGRLQRQRNGTPRNATTLRLDGRFGNAATQRVRNWTPKQGTQTGNATHGRQTRNRSARPHHGFVNCGQLARRDREKDRTRHNATGRYAGLHNALR
jgi:hypothetical protein